VGRGVHSVAIRLEVAREAAKIIAESGRRDLRAAKLKAANRLGVKGQGDLPSNREVHLALVDYQRLFSVLGHHERIDEMLDFTERLMRQLTSFEPRLVGPLANGTADENSAVILHLFSDFEEEVSNFLANQNFQFRSGQGQAKYSASRIERIPTYALQLVHGGNQRTSSKATQLRANVDLWVFPFDGLRQAPIDPAIGRPIRRVSVGKLSELSAHYHNISTPW